MSFRLMQRVADTLGLAAIEKAVLAVLARHAQDDGTNAKPPSVDTIAAKAGITGRAARRVLRSLEENGFLDAPGSKVGGKSGPTRYVVVAEKLAPFIPDSAVSTPIDEGRTQSPPLSDEGGHRVRPYRLMEDTESAEETLDSKITEANASGADAPVEGRGEVVKMRLTAGGELFGPVLADLVAAIPRQKPDVIRAKLAKAKACFGPDKALAVAKQAALRDEPWSYLCKVIDNELHRAAAGGRPMESGNARMAARLAEFDFGEP